MAEADLVVLVDVLLLCGVFNCEVCLSTRFLSHICLSSSLKPPGTEFRMFYFKGSLKETNPVGPEVSSHDFISATDMKDQLTPSTSVSERCPCCHR